jgi:C2H2 type zinc finger protein
MGNITKIKTCEIHRIWFQIWSFNNTVHAQNDPKPCLVFVLLLQMGNRLCSNTLDVFKIRGIHLATLPGLHIAKMKRFHECSSCEKKYSRKDHLTRHMASVHERSTLFTCEYCPKIFYIDYKLKRHVQSHRKIQCPHCNEYFESKVELSTHLFDVGVFFPCPATKCMQIFSLQAALDEHFQLSHSRRTKAVHKLYHCTHDNCDKVFHARKQLSIHVKQLHAQPNKKLHDCNLCGKSFSSAYSLKTHTSTFHLKLRKYSCQSCNKARFMHMKSLKQHIQRCRVPVAVDF